MARMPGVPWRPLASNWASQPALSAHHIVCLHTMVGSLSSAENYFRLEGYGGAESHFGVGYNGTIYQWQDTSRRADANLDGNDRVISIETADMGTGFPAWSGTNVPAWTSGQLDAIARILAWCHTKHGIPLKLIPNSAQSSRGIGYHRQGVDPWRCSSCELWSNAYGKVCPGDRRIAQIPTVIARAIAFGDDMTPEQAKQLDDLHKRLGNVLDPVNSKQYWVTNALKWMWSWVAVRTPAQIARVEDKVDQLAAAQGTPVDTTAIEALTAELAAVRALLQEVADGQVTPDRLADELAERLSD